MTQAGDSVPILPMVRQQVEQSYVDLVAARLKATREFALEISAAELCRRTGVESNTYSQWEGAKRIPRLDQAFLLCDAFGYTLDWIYRDKRDGLPGRILSKLPKIIPPIES